METTKEIEIYGEWFVVDIEYDIFGRYIPATRIDPAEYPEVDWHLVRCIDADGNEVTDSDTLKAIEAHISQSDFETECLESAQEERADRAFDDYREREW